MLYIYIYICYIYIYRYSASSNRLMLCTIFIYFYECRLFWSHTLKTEHWGSWFVQTTCHHVSKIWHADMLVGCPFYSIPPCARLAVGVAKSVRRVNGDWRASWEPGISTRMCFPHFLCTWLWLWHGPKPLRRASRALHRWLQIVPENIVYKISPVPRPSLTLRASS